ncbi:MAG: hypothetical protein VX610_00040 [SAR324 cluster bacterium]|nr:hypothetical protein [SAR324 cluster bacterium]
MPSDGSERQRESDFEKEENYLNLWGYIKRRYPDVSIEDINFTDLVRLKVQLEGPRRLREWTGDIASVRKH